MQAKVDVEFLEKATAQLVQSNNNLRTSLAESERKLELEEEAKVLKEDLGKSRDQARFKEREERSLLQVSLTVPSLTWNLQLQDRDYASTSMSQEQFS